MSDADIEDAEEIPEVDFSRGIQPHRYARLRPGYQYVVYLDRDLWEHFGSGEEVIAALRALVGAAGHVRTKPGNDIATADRTE